VEKYRREEQATDNMAQTHFVVDTKGYK